MKASTLLATPAYNGLDVGYVKGIVELSVHNLLPDVCLLPEVADVRLARNLLAHVFLTRTSHRSLVFIDSDMGFGAEDFLRLEGEHSAVCMTYARRAPRADPVSFGLGFCRIDREVFEALKPHVNTFTMEGSPGAPFPGTVYDFFEQGPQDAGGAWCSESWRFWQRVEAAGIHTRFETGSHLIHYGRQGFTL